MAGESAEFFHARAVIMGKPNRLYRVFLEPAELVFIYAGAGGDYAFFGGQKPETAKRLEHLDKTPLAQLMADHPHNFRAALADVSDVRIEPFSWWQAILYSTGKRHAGRLTFLHRPLGRFVLEVPTVDEMRQVVNRVPEIFGDKVVVNVCWDDQAKKYIAKPAPAETAPAGSAPSP